MLGTGLKENVFAAKTIRLYVVEEQEMYQRLYRGVFAEYSTSMRIEVVAMVANSDARVLSASITSLSPDVLLVGAKKMDRHLIEEVQALRKDFPEMGILLLPVSYEMEDIALARKLSSQSRAGTGLFMKQSLNVPEELCRMVVSVSQGQVILDPTVANAMFAEKPEYPFIKQLTAREFEILGLVSRGYTNSAIADCIFTDVKTVENHINTLYSKLRSEEILQDRNPRVVATRIYLSATGDLVGAATPLR